MARASSELGPELTTSSSGAAGVRRHRFLLLAATAMTAVLLTSGGVVCVTESGRGCPDWPRCYGRMVPPMRIDSIIEYSHRVVAGLTSPLIIAAMLVGLMKFRSIRWVSRPPAVAVAFLIVVVTLGALTVLRGIPPWAAAIDLGSALIVLALMLTASIVACSGRDDLRLADRLSFERGFARVALLAAASLFAVLVSGVLVADSGSIVRCLGCLAARPGLGGGAGRAWIQMGRDVLAGVASLSIVALGVAAWRTEWDSAPIRRTVIASGALLVAQVLISAVVAKGGVTPWLLIASVATAVAAWVSLIALVILGGLRGAESPRVL